MSPILTVSTATAWTMSPAFWGADVRVYYPLGPIQAATVNASPIQYIRWPGGAVADQYNFTSNVITADGGSTYSPPSNESQFAAWCRQVGCRAIVQLPAEINDAATGAYYVRYTLSVLHFHPAYWEIGNEPARWTHYGFPWSSWNSTQRVNATPGSYAATVHAYVQAIRAVDPGARIIGLPGVGTGGYNEDTWIRATVRANGPNLSAVAIHVYPAGGHSNATATASTFYASLSGKGAIPYRVPRDRAAILSGCSTCTGVALFVTELGSGTMGGPYTAAMNRWASVPFVADELAQAIQYRLANVDVFALQSSYGGSLLNATAVPSLVATLYSQMLVHLQPIVLGYALSTTPGEFGLVPARNANGTIHSLLAVNANATTGVRVVFSGVAFPILHAGTYWYWDGSTAAPRSGSWSLGAGPASVLLAPRSVLVIQVA